VPPGILAEHLEKICESEGIKVAKGVIPLVVRASGGSVRDALSVLGQLLAGAGKAGVTYEIAIQLLGYTDGALLDEAIDAMAARDGATLFKAIDRVIESGHDPRRFTQDFLERLRDLIIVGAVEESASQILREIPEDQLQRMRAQASIIGTANLIRSADIVAAGLTQMRGATAPRLMLELICGRILLPGSDDIGLVSRVERLELRENISVPQPVAAKAEVKAEPKADVKAEPKKVEVKEIKEDVKEEVKAPIRAAAPTPSANKPTGPIDAAALRRFWPEVIENVKKRRRLTWSLLSSSAHVLSVDENAITIGIVNAGARDSFTRSGSDEILRAAFVDVTGLDLKIECVVDASANTSAPSSRAAEDPSDADQMSGQELLMRELGAQIISETKKD
jgi:DNA polymerase-3 subunit gamma/tau